MSLYPLPIRLPGFLSFLYLWLGAIVAIGVDFLLLDHPQYVLTILLILMGLGVSFKHYMHKESGGWPGPLNKVEYLKKFSGLPPLIAMVLAGVLAGIGVYYLNRGSLL